LEISFERTCNFSCSYCNPAFSTAWVRDIKKFGPYRNIVSDGRGHFIDTAPWAENAAEKDDDNPYIQAFWKWWNSSLSDNLEEIRITGGEPLMAPSVWKLFDWFKANPTKGAKMRYAVNSNLVPKKALLDKLIEMSHHVPHFEIYTSNESVGAHSEYIRDGMEYQQWLDNIERLIVEGNVERLHCMMTINSLCLASITEFMDDMLAIKRKHGAQWCAMSLNILRFPSFQACAILPEEIKHKYKLKLEEWYNKQVEANEVDSKGWQIFNDWERAQTLRLVDYLDVVKTPHKNTAETPKLYNDFKNFYLQYDVRRGKDFRTTFPKEFVDFLDSIDVATPTATEILTQVYASETERSRAGDPATTADYDIDNGHGWDTTNDTLGKNG
jgi:organic radical activating enzyme